MPSSLNQSIKQVGPGRWHVGSFVRERITTKIQPEDDAIAAGVEDDCTYILQTSKDGDIVSPLFMDASDAIQMVHEGGTSSVVWTIGRHVFCKVKARHPDMESRGEYDQIRYKKNHTAGSFAGRHSRLDGAG